MMLHRSFAGQALIFLLAVCAPATASGLLPEPRQQDVQAVQACLGSRNLNLAVTCVGTVADACMATVRNQQPLMAECIVRERTVWDRFLNNDYEAVIAALRPGVREQVRAVEADYAINLDRRCGLVREAWGDGYAITDIEQCKLRATAMQWLWLRDFPMKREKPPRPL